MDEILSPPSLEKTETPFHKEMNHNGVHLVFRDFDHQEEIPEDVVRFINDPNVGIVVPEYFYPQLQRNAKTWGLEGKMDVKMNDPVALYGPRLRAAKKLSDVLLTIEKDVAVVDIAHTADYMLYRTVLDHMPLFLSALNACLLPITKNRELVLFGDFMALFLLILHFSHANLDTRHARESRGIYSKEEITAFDKFGLDFESARRIYAAKGIDTLTKLSPERRGGEGKSILILAPKAHLLRYIDHLQHPNMTPLKRMQEAVYTIMGPTLEKKVMLWKARVLDNIARYHLVKKVPYLR